MEIFTLRNLTFRYPKSENDVLKNLNFSLSSGEFTALCGPSGCGKSTLLRQMKTALTPHGFLSGEILFEGKPLAEADNRRQSEKIGFISQSPDNQIVSDKVWHELAFGLESLGLDNALIRGRVAEMASFFGIEEWFEKDINELSGGQKQLLNLASVMVMRPDILLLDEPTSQLDPIAASEFLSVLGRVNRDLGTTVFISEHRLEEVFFYCGRVLVMDEGRIAADGTIKEVGLQLREQNHKMFLSMPSPMKIWAAVSDAGNDCPVSVSEGRCWLENYSQRHSLLPIADDEITAHTQTPSVVVNNIWFRYEKNAPDVLKGAQLKAYPGELLAILGGNGTGKSSLLSLLTRAHKPYRGKIFIDGQPLEEAKKLFNRRLGVLPQNPQSLFVQKTVFDDLYDIFSGSDIPEKERREKIADIITLCNLEHIADRHPYDLSGGEQQRAALAKVLLTEPRILLLDEPTKGFDAEFKEQFASILYDLLEQNVTIVMVSHDVEFCAKYAHRCALLFNGSIVSENNPRAFFANNNFYTTSVNRMSRDKLPTAITDRDVIAACGGVDGQNKPDKKIKKNIEKFEQHDDESDSEKESKLQGNLLVKPTDSLSFWQKIAAVFGGLTFCIAVAGAMNWIDLSPIVGLRSWSPYIMLLFPLLFFFIAFAGKTGRHLTEIQTPTEKRKLNKRSSLAAFAVLLMVPVTIFVGTYYLGGKKYLFISLLILFECMLPFFIAFEGRKPQARELVIISLLCALGIAGRTGFFMFPQFKPVAALVIIAGVSFGGETGFIVGAISMLISNIMARQGPWTPWQVFAMGLIGFLAGFLYKTAFLRRNRVSLCVFGFFAILLLYGGIMNLSSAIMVSAELNWPTLASYFLSGLPMDLVHAAATFTFLFFFSEMMIEKLDRVKIKYGILE